MHGVHNGLKPAMRSELVVDVVEMVGEFLQADPQRPGAFGQNSCRLKTTALCFAPVRRVRIQEPAVLSRCIRDCNNLFGELKHRATGPYCAFFRLAWRTAVHPDDLPDTKGVGERP